ncbi:gamma-glutamyltransferase [candidate division KSB1 bacterium]
MKRLFYGLIILFTIIYPTSGILISSSHNPVAAKNGMVVSTHELASQAGIEILKNGGNAVDAAVAVGYALAVTFPAAGNIGGGGFMVIRFKDGSKTAVDYREKAPGSAHEKMYLDENGEVIEDASTLGYLASGVPGAVAGMNLALEKYGTMSLEEVLKPAVRLAEKGFKVSWGFAKSLNAHKEDFVKFPESAKIFTKQDGGDFEFGDMFIQKDLAKTLKLIAEKGNDGFYKGKTAQLIEKQMKSNGGSITAEDLEDYEAEIRKPIEFDYRGYNIISMSPPSSGGVAIAQLLNIVEEYDIGSLGHNSSKTIHLLTEAERRVYADRAEYLGDPDYVNIPVEGLISKEYAAKLRKSIKTDLASDSREISHGKPAGYESEETTHYSVVDRWGNAVATTTTLNGGYGSHVVIDGAGFLLNNEMDDFSIKPGYPNIYGLIGGYANSIQPGKRMLSSMTPTIVEKDGELFMVTGTPGGATIITTVFQVIMNVIDHKMNIQDAVNAVRIHHQWFPDRIQPERKGLPVDVIENLRKMGHEVKERGSIGDAHSILYDAKNKLLFGAADPRLEGKAAGY